MSGVGKEYLQVYMVEKMCEINEKATQCHTSQSPDQVQETGWKADILNVMAEFIEHCW